MGTGLFLRRGVCLGVEEETKNVCGKNKAVLKWMASSAFETASYDLIFSWLENFAPATPQISEELGLLQVCGFLLKRGIWIFGKDT